LKCPYCSYNDDNVIDSRVSKGGAVIRRRRECKSCGRRFTTYERVEEMLPMVIKKDNRRENFDRMKILLGMQLACKKRPVSTNVLEQLVEKIERYFQDLGEKEIPSTVVGEKVMEELKVLDDVAYIRFASVYRQFKDLNEFMDVVKSIKK
jgi:transcriptional repressor NrdR